MKIGSVLHNSGYLFPSVPIKIHHDQGQPKLVEALLDSGFSGMVSLPAETVKELELKYVRTQEVTLADGTLQAVEVFAGSVCFAGKWRKTSVLSTGDEATVGMGLISGGNISFDAVPGGDILYTPLDIRKPR